MTQRRVNVLHVLAARSVNGRNQFLLYPHDKWSAPDSGKPYLALPTKKIIQGDNRSPPGSDALDETLAAVLRDDLGGEAGNPPVERRLAPATLRMRSPTQGRRTTYTISPVLVRVEPGHDDALRTRLRGKWLTAGQALRHARLSPTVRCLLQGADGIVLGRAAPDEWTERLTRAGRSDLSLFGSLFEEMRPWLVGRLRACVCTSGLFQVPDEVEDALQDAAVNALTHLHRFDPDRGSARGWLWRITHNCAVTLLRRRTVRRACPLSPDGGRPGNDVVDDGYDPSEVVERKETLDIARRRLEAALAKAGPMVRKAWELRSIHGKEYAEIVRELNLPLGTIATWFHRLKKAVEGDDPCRG